MDSQICPSCKKQISNEANFCPNCGKKIKEPPASTTILSQLGVYAISVLFPPFGIIPALKYLKQNDQAAKNIGIIAILLTFLSIIIGIWLSIYIVSQVQNTINAQLQLQSSGLNL